MYVIMTKAGYAAVHKDFKGMYQGVRTVMRMTDKGSTLLEVRFDDGKELRQGRKVICNGYPGAIIRRYSGAMVEVRLERGAVCVDIGDLIFLED